VCALDTHIFRDDAEVMGRLVYDLGNAYQRIGHLVGNASVLFHFVHSPFTQPMPDGVTEQTIRTTMEYIRAVSDPLSRARMDRTDASLIVDEFANAVRMLRHGCRRALAVRTGIIDTESEREILGEHRRLWLARNREGGLQDSTRVLEQRLTEYER